MLDTIDEINRLYDSIERKAMLLEMYAKYGNLTILELINKLDEF